MSNPERAFVIICLSAVCLFASAARSMEIMKFDRIAIPDQGSYVQWLLQGARALLIEAGQREQVAKLDRLFNDIPQGDQMSIGMLQFEKNLDRGRLFDVERYTKDRDTRRLEVEDVMLVTLKKNGIVLPKKVVHVADNFKPRYVIQ